MDFSNLRYRLHYLRLALQGLRLPIWLHDWFGHWSWGTRLASVAAVFIGYYGIGALVVNQVDTNPAYMDKSAPVGAHYSRAVAAAAQLTLREVDLHHWTPADPFFLPGSVLSAMPRFQQGMIAAIGHFAETLTQLDNGNNGDLSLAAGLYKYPGTVWRLASGISWLPTAPSSRQYRRAAHALETFDDQLANLDKPNLVQQGTGLVAVIDGFSTDLDTMTDRLVRHLDGDPSAFFDGQGRALFHSDRGHFYAWGVILTELGKDDAELLRDHGLTGQWARLTEIAFKAAAMDPGMVTVGQGMVANHLEQQGFALLRARKAAGEIKAALLP
jgi:hypothetical protein